MDIYIYMFQFQVLLVRGYPPHGMFSPWKAGPTHCVMLATASCADCVLQPSVQNAPFHTGGGEEEDDDGDDDDDDDDVEDDDDDDDDHDDDDDNDDDDDDDDDDDVCVCVDIACVFYTSSWYVPSVTEGDQLYPPPAERNWHIYDLK